MKKLFLLGLVALNLFVGVEVTSAHTASVITGITNQANDMRIYFSGDASHTSSQGWAIFGSKFDGEIVPCANTHLVGTISSSSVGPGGGSWDFKNGNEGDVIGYRISQLTIFGNIDAETCSNQVAGFWGKPYAPTSIVATNDLSDKIKVTWNVSPSRWDGTSLQGMIHTVYRSTQLGGDYVGVYEHTMVGSRTLNTLDWEDTGVVSGTTYYYKVSAKMSGIESALFGPDDGRMVPLANYLLTVSKSGTGSGTVTSSPTGINCGSDCSQSYTSGTSVTLTAVATSGSFAGWSGGGCSGTGTCTVTMDAAKTVTAGFTTGASLNSISASCSGSSVSPATISWSGGTSPYSIGVIEASRTTPPPNTSSFWHTANWYSGTSISTGVLTWWNGSSDDTTQKLALKTSTTYSSWVYDNAGNFSNVVQFTTPACAATTYLLTVSKPGTGSGTVTSSPAGINCGSDCTQNYNSGTSVTLTAVATSGTFTGWSGGGCSGTGTCTVTMNAAKTVTATFTAAAGAPRNISSLTPSCDTNDKSRISIGYDDQIGGQISVIVQSGNKSGDPSLPYWYQTYDEGSPRIVTDGDVGKADGGVNPLALTGGATYTAWIWSSALGGYGAGFSQPQTFVASTCSAIPPPPSSCDASVDTGGTWKAPSVGTVAPAGNASTTLNIGAKSQIKAGCLTIGRATQPTALFPLYVEGNAFINGTLNTRGLTVTGDIAYSGTLTNISDQRLKTNITSLGETLSRVLKLRPITFKWKDVGRGTKTQIGLIAQEVEPLFPEVVKTGADGYKSLDYTALVSPLIKATQEQQTQIDELKQELQALKSGK